MKKLPVVRPAGPELMPWQAALMIVCVTAAGVLHEQAGSAVRPVANGREAARMGVPRGGHPAAALDVVMLPRR